MKDKDRDLRDEIRAHLEMATADRVERGETAAEASAAARRELGNLSQIQEATRDVWGRRRIENVRQDVGYALRLFRRNPGFALVAILSLTLGIGANTALFEIVNAVRLRSLPVADPSRLVDVGLTNYSGARGNFANWHPGVTAPIWREIQARQQAFDGIFAWGTDTFTLSNGGEIRAARGLWVTGDFFATLGLHAALGRTLTADDDRPGCPGRAVLSYGFWQKAYGGDPTVVGRLITLSARPIEIVGVAPAGFHGLEVGRTFDTAIPVCADRVFSDDGKGRLESGTNWWLNVFGRLKSGWSVERASAHLQAISPAVFQASLQPGYPAVSVSKYLASTLEAQPAGSGLSQLRENYESPLSLLLGIAGLVLAIACANLANLLLARATARQREFAVRLGLGASRGRVVRQLLTEGIVLAAFGTAGALLLANSLSGALLRLLGSSDPGLTLTVGLDARVAAFAVALAVVTTLLFSLAPAIKGTRLGAGAVMRASGRGTTATRESVGLRRGLVVAQVAVSVALLFGSLLFARSLRNVTHVDPGFTSDGVIVASVNYRRLGVPAERRAGFRRDLLDRVRALPGVENAASVAVVPISGDSGGNDVWPEADRSRLFNVRQNMVGPGYFRTLRIPLVAGRDFDGRDSPSSPRVAIVNEAFVSAMPTGGGTIGSRFTREATPGSPETTFEIVGIVRNSKYEDLKEPDGPTVNYADTQDTQGGYARIVMRSQLPASAVTGAMTRALAGIDPRIGVTYSVLSADIRDTVLRERLLAMLSAGFGALAALLTMVGLYGLVAYTVTRRTNEIGVRIALGATPNDIARLMMRETGMLLLGGVAVGVLLALAGGRTTATLLFGVQPYDLATLAAAVGTLALIAFAASYAPARRATRIPPVTALRAD